MIWASEKHFLEVICIELDGDLGNRPRFWCRIPKRIVWLVISWANVETCQCVTDRKWVVVMVENGLGYLCDVHNIPSLLPFLIPFCHFVLLLQMISLLFIYCRLFPPGTCVACKIFYSLIPCHYRNSNHISTAELGQAVNGHLRIHCNINQLLCPSYTKILAYQYLSRLFST